MAGGANIQRLGYGAQIVAVMRRDDKGMNGKAGGGVGECREIAAGIERVLASS